MRGKLVKILGRILPERKHPAEKQSQIFALIAVVKFLRWPTIGLLGLLALWILGGNFLADRQQHKIEQSLTEWKKQFPKTEPNDSALKLRALVAKLGISSVVSTSEFSIDAYTRSHPDFRPSEAEKNDFENIGQELRGYLDEQLGKEGDEIDAPPEKLQQYLKSKAAVIEDIRNHVSNNEVPRWQTDINYILEGKSDWQSPSYVGLANLQQILALDILEKQRQGKSKAASEMLEVSWKINQSLRDIPDLIGQLVALIVGIYPTGVMRKFDNIPVELQQRLKEHDYRESLLKSVEGEFIITLNSSKLSNQSLYRSWKFNLSFSGIRWDVYGPIFQPYMRLAAIDYVTAGRRATTKMHREKNEQNICLLSAVEIDDDIAWWNLLYKDAVRSFINQERHAAQHMLELELNQKILQVKELAAKKGQWPKSLPDRSSSICPGFQWVYQVSRDGTMSIFLSNQPEWLVERIEKNSMLPLTYRDRTPPRPNQDSYREDLKDVNNEWQQRSQGAYRLWENSGELGLGATSKVIADLIEALKDEDEVVRLRATFALANIGEDAVSDLIAELDEEREEVRASVIFALREIELPAMGMLTKVLNKENQLVRNNAIIAIGKIAEDFQERVEVVSPSDLNEVIKKLNVTQEAIENLINTPLSITITELELKEECIRKIRKSINALKFARTNRDIKIILLLLVWLLSMVIIVLLFRPELGLQLSRNIWREKEKRETLDQILSQVEQFLKQAGARTRRDRQSVLLVTSILGKIDSYTPLPVKVITEQDIDQGITELVQHGARLARNPQGRAGIIIYGKEPDAMFRIQIFTVRLKEHFFVIPITLAEVQKSLREHTASGLLADYAKRYLPGANLFDDRNAIGDTLLFFGREKLIKDLEENLRRNQWTGLFGLRKLGKTSVLLQLGFAMGQHPVVHVDLQRCSQLHYGAELFNQILQQLSQYADKRNLSRSHSAVFAGDIPASELTAEFVGRVSKLVKSLEKAGYQLPILCFLDEIERILPREGDPKAKAEEFNACFGALRALSQEKELLSLLVADVHPDCNRINHWSQAGVPTNPVCNFFKEVFVLPFSPEDTKKMLKDIGKPMGVEFDEETLAAIHRETGGHPFIARQLASLLYQKLAKDNNGQIQWSAARRYVTKPFSYSGLLKDYFKENIWADLNKRNFQEAMAILRLLACNETVAEGVLLARLAREFTQSECIDALLWLEAVGLVSRRESDEGDTYQIEVPLMSRWLQMQMKDSEIRQWQIL